MKSRRTITKWFSERIGGAYRALLSPLHVLLILGMLVVVGGLLTHLRIQHHRLNRRLVEAVQSGNAETVRTLLNQGTNPNYRFDPGKEVTGIFDWAAMLDNLQNRNSAIQPSVLMLAAEAGDVAVANALLKRGADIHATGNNGSPVIHWAMKYNFSNPKMIALLLDKGADPNAKDAVGATALLNASAKGNKEAIRILLARGADIRVQTTEGDTPLTLAAQFSYGDTIKLLLDNGADASLKNRHGKTAYDIAYSRGYRDMIEPLQRAKTSP